jgi:hypothetical protein
MTRIYKVAMRYPDGTTMFMGTLVAEEVTDVTTDQPSVRRAPSNNDQAGSDSAERMTDPQKRYLFRLLGAQGVSGKAAEEHLRQYFHVGKLADIQKASASDYINQLVKDKQNATGIST